MNEKFDHVLAMMAPGTDLHEALDMVLAAHTGALICIGDVENVLAVGNGGFKIGVPFTPQRLFELAKMDGAIVLDEEARTIVRANFHLNPDSLLPTTETGMRHRTASRTSMQTAATVISVSQRRSVVNVYLGGSSVALDSVEMVLSRANQGILALQNSRAGLDKAIRRLMGLEIDNLVTVAAVAQVIRRSCNLVTISRQVKRYNVYLGVTGNLLNLQHEEIMQGAEEAYLITVRDYAADSSLSAALRIRQQIGALPPSELASPSRIAALLGLGEDHADEDHLVPRGIRAMMHLPFLSDEDAEQIVDEYGSLTAIMDNVKESIGSVSATSDLDEHAVAASLQRLRERP